MHFLFVVWYLVCLNILGNSMLCKDQCMIVVSFDVSQPMQEYFTF